MIRHHRLAALSAAVLGALAVAAAPPAASPDAEPLIFDDESAAADCTQFVPRQEPAVSGVTDDGQAVDLDVLVLIDTEGTLAVAEQLRDADSEAAQAAADDAFAAFVADHEALVAAGDESYAALDVHYALTWDLYQPFEADGSARDRSTEDARNAELLIQGAKDQLGGARPADVDLVYVLTDRDIFAAGVGDAVAGLADCIGGVEWDEHAFAVGEIFPSISLGLEFYREGTAKVMAHELGHLMGAHHHYQSCGPHAVGEALAGGFGACSLMTNFVDTTTFEFSPLNGGIVRANAVDHASG